MKMVCAAATAALTLFCAAGASAQTESPAGRDIGYYGTLGYTRFNDNDDTDVSLGAATARLGARARYFGLEAEGTLGVGENTVSEDGFDVDVSLEHQVAFYGVAFLPVGQNGDLFARFGLAQVEFQAKAFGETIQADDGALAYGVGGQYFFGGGANGLRADYTRFEISGNDEDLSGEIDTFSIAYVRRF